MLNRPRAIDIDLDRRLAEGGEDCEVGDPLHFCGPVPHVFGPSAHAASCAGWLRSRRDCAHEQAHDLFNARNVLSIAFEFEVERRATI